MKSAGKSLMQSVLFLLLMLLTFYVIFSKNDLPSMMAAIKDADLSYLVLSIAAACFFVSAEGFILWYLLQSTQAGTGLLRCIGYSFIGFFFSGITPSSTGGQPMQLYYMKKDGVSLGDGTLVLMIAAVLYKFVITLVGVILLIVGKDTLEQYLGGYMILFYLGMFLNILLVVILLAVMLNGSFMQSIIVKGDRLLTALHVLKPSDTRREGIGTLIAGYKDTLRFFLSHKGKILFAAGCTFLQRCCLFLLTCFIYRSLHLSEVSFLTIAGLQASVFIAVDMLPLPGAQGISELLYHTVFMSIFPGSNLAASMCMTRGISFYLPLLAGALVTAARVLFPQQINQCKNETTTE